MNTKLEKPVNLETIFEVVDTPDYVPVWEKPQQIHSGQKVEAPDISMLNLEQSVGFSIIVSFVFGKLMRTNPKDGKSYPVTMLVLQGVAGTGKSFLTTKVVQFILSKNQKLKIAFLTPTHQAGTAAKKMSSLAAHSSVAFKTIHSVGGVRKKKDQATGKELFQPVKPATFEEYDVCFIDEAGMVGESLYNLVRDYAGKTLFIWTGDPAQLPPVGEVKSKAYDTGQDFWTNPITEEQVVTQRIELLEPMRAALTHPITAVATRIRRREIDIKQVRNVLTEEGFRVVRPGLRDREHGVDGDLDDLLVQLFMSDHYKQDSDYCTLITWTNKSVGQWNRRIRRLINSQLTGRRTVTNVPTLFPREYIKLQQAYVVESEQGGEDESPYLSTSTEELGEQVYNNNANLRVIDYEPYSLTVPGVDIEVPALLCTVEHEIGGVWVERKEVPVILSDNIELYEAALYKLWGLVVKDDSYRAVYWNLRGFGPVLARYNYASTTHKMQGLSNWFNIVDAKNIASCKYFPKTKPEQVRLDEYWRMLYTGGTRAKKGILYLV